MICEQQVTRPLDALNYSNTSGGSKRARRCQGQKGSLQLTRTPANVSDAQRLNRECLAENHKDC